MELLLRIGLSNAILAAVLAIVVAGLSRFCRRPALVHSLWLLVLLKLVTPPLYWVKVFSLTRHDDSPAVATEEAVAAHETPKNVVSAPPANPSELAPRQVAADMPIEPAPGDLQRSPPEFSTTSPSAALPPAPTGLTQEAEFAEATIDWAGGLRSVAGLAVPVWAAGSALWLALAAVRAIRFHRLLRQAQPAPASLQQLAGRLARRLGLGLAPPVFFVPGRVSPMLWALVGRARLLVPAELWERLPQDQREALLLHELAHFRRRDHWLRLFELAVTAIYWWNPVAWWALLELRRAEEDCCDAWVVWALPRHARAYATALVETLDFLSESRTALPLGASGIGHIQDLRRRVTMIMCGTTPRALTWSGVLCIAGLAAFLLPILPTLAQEDPFGGKDDRPKAEKGDKLKDPADAQDELRRKTEEQRFKAEIERARAELEKARAEIELKRADLLKAEMELKAAETRLSRMKTDGHDKKEKARKIIIIIEGSDGKRREIEIPGEVDLQSLLGWQVKMGQGGFMQVPGFGGTGLPPGGNKIPGAPPGSGPGQPGGGFPGGAPPGQGLPSQPGGFGVVPPGASHANPDRMQELEKRLDHLMQEIDELRKQLSKQRGKEEQSSNPSDAARNAAIKALLEQATAEQARDAAIQALQLQLQKTEPKNPEKRP